MSAEALEIHIIADSTGETGARIARAAIAQFPGAEHTIVRHRRMSSPEQVIRALDALPADRPAAVLFTLVDHTLAELVTRTCKERGIPHADLMTPSLLALQAATGVTPVSVARRPVGVEADYFTRVNAIDFAVRHDDGALPAQLHEADIVLVGPSRAGKTPLSIFLGYMGYKVANLPLVPGIPTPPGLAEVHRWRIVGLIMDPEKLQAIRQRRVRSMGGFQAHDGYTELVSILDELDEVGATLRSLGCPLVNTTGVALEENASRVIDLVSTRALRHDARLQPPPGVRGKSE